MKKRSVLLLRGLAVASLLAVCPRPAEAFIKIEPMPLGWICREATHLYVLKVEKVSKVRGVILFKHVEQLKGMPDGTVPKYVIRSGVKGAKVILDWAAEGKTLVMLVQVSKGGKGDKGDGSVYGRGHAYIDGYWYMAGYEGQCWTMTGEPAWLTQYCGTADNLRDALAKILRGEEVVVPCMVGDDKQALEQGRGQVQEFHASLKILDNDSRNAGGDKKPDPGDKKSGGKDPGGKNSGDKNPGGKKGDERKPDLVGTVKALSGDGKSFTLLRPPSQKNPEPIPIGIQIGERTTITPGKLAVGQTVSVWFGKGDAKIAVEIQIGKPAEKPDKKPAPEDMGGKPAEKGGKPVPDVTEKKPETPKKPREPAKPARDPAPAAAVIDAEVDRHLAAVKVSASPQAADAEFLRRVGRRLTREPGSQQDVTSQPQVGEAACGCDFTAAWGASRNNFLV